MQKPSLPEKPSYHDRVWPNQDNKPLIPPDVLMELNGQGSPNADQYMEYPGKLIPLPDQYT